MLADLHFYASHLIHKINQEKRYDQDVVQALYALHLYAKTSHPHEKTHLLWKELAEVLEQETVIHENLATPLSEVLYELEKQFTHQWQTLFFDKVFDSSALKSILQKIAHSLNQELYQP